MNKDTLQILGMGHFHPENVIDNSFLEALNIGTSDEWILERVGIRERRTVLPLEYIFNTRNQNCFEAGRVAKQTIMDMGAKAARIAMDKAGVTPSEIGLVIAGSCSPEIGFPAHSCVIAATLGIQCPAFDLHSSCATFASQLHFINSMNFIHLPDYILLVQCESLTSATNYSDRSTAVLFGDGAAAAVISPRRKGKAKVMFSTFGANPSGWDKVFTYKNSYIIQQGSQVQRFAIKQTANTFKELQEKTAHPITHFIGHQANLRMLEAVCGQIQIPREKHSYNVDLFGNCGGASAPAVLSRDWDQFKSEDLLAIAVVGAGLSWGGVILKFGDPLS